MSSFKNALLLTRKTSHRLVNRRTEAVLAPIVVAAIDSASRRRGLLGLNGMPDGEALVIAPCNAIHTWFMRFAIDVLFVRKNGEVVKRYDAVRPWRIALAWRAFAAIELAAGTLRASETVPGDVVEIVPMRTERRFQMNGRSAGQYSGSPRAVKIGTVLEPSPRDLPRPTGKVPDRSAQIGQLRRSLLETAGDGGGWGYYPRKASRIEPTCWALLALAATSNDPHDDVAGIRRCTLAIPRATVSGRTACWWTCNRYPIWASTGCAALLCLQAGGSVCRRDPGAAHSGPRPRQGRQRQKTRRVPPTPCRDGRGLKTRSAGSSRPLLPARAETRGSVALLNRRPTRAFGKPRTSCCREVVRRVGGTTATRASTIRTFGPTFRPPLSA